jgi:hypothetical protein
MFLIGLLVVWMGAQAVVRRELTLWRRRRITSSYTGLPAQLVGLNFGLFGAFMMIMAVADYFARAAFNAFWSSPYGRATGMLLVGLVGALHGGALLAGGSYMSPQSWFRVPRRVLRGIGGALLLSVSLCVTLVSAAALLAPRWLTQVDHPLLEFYRRWLG